jgi:hypothetical protein
MTRYYSDRKIVKNNHNTTSKVKCELFFEQLYCPYIGTGYMYKNLVWWIKYSQTLFKEIEF